MGEDSLFVMANEGAITTTLQAMRAQPFNAALLIAGIDALSNIAEDDLNMERMIREGAVKDIIQSMQVNLILFHHSFFLYVLMILLFHCDVYIL